MPDSSVVTTGPRRTPARVVFGVTAVVSGVSLVIQLVLIVIGVNVLVDDAGAPAVGLGERLVRFVSYFTVQSNVLVVVSSAMLAGNPVREGWWFRLLRIAGLVGITVTFVVYLIALRPILDLHGMSAATDFGLHLATPVLAVVGWLVWGPRPRFTARVLLWFLIWPAAYFAYSLIRGAVTGWYPYPFVDVTVLGYPVALRNLAVVTILLLVVGALYLVLDRRLTAR